jgi:hypothetical protein
MIEFKLINLENRILAPEQSEECKRTLVQQGMILNIGQRIEEPKDEICSEVLAE